MKILILVVDINLTGGGERVATNLANGFAEVFGYKAEVISIQKIEDTIPFSLSQGVSVSTAGVELHKSGLIRKVVSRCSAIRRTRSKVASMDANFILGIGAFASIILGVSKKDGKKKIGCEHVSAYGLNRFWKVLQRMTYPHLDAVVCLTDQARTASINLNKKIEVIPNSATFHPSIPKWRAEKKILGVGCLSPEKNFGQLIEAFRLIAEEFPDWAVEIIGEGSEKSKLDHLIQEYNLHSRITIRPNTQDIEQEYRKAGLLVLTSLHEGLPMVLIEALCCGLPSIAFDCPDGPREIIAHERTGFLVPLGDVRALAERMSELMRDAALRTVMSQNALIESNRFSKKKVLEMWRALFESLVEG